MNVNVIVNISIYFSHIFGYVKTALELEHNVILLTVSVQVFELAMSTLPLHKLPMRWLSLWHY